MQAADHRRNHAPAREMERRNNNGGDSDQDDEPRQADPVQQQRDRQHREGDRGTGQDEQELGEPEVAAAGTAPGAEPRLQPLG